MRSCTSSAATQLKEDPRPAELERFARVPQLPQARLEALNRSRREGEPEARGSLVGKDERQPEKPAERQQPPRQRVEQRDDDAGDDADPAPPAEEHPQRARRDAREGDDDLHGRDRGHDRQPENEHA